LEARNISLSHHANSRLARATKLVGRIGNHRCLQGIEQRIVAGGSDAGEFFVAAEGSAGARLRPSPAAATCRTTSRTRASAATSARRSARVLGTGDARCGVKQLGMGVERFVGLLVFAIDPPGELGVIQVVEVEPGAQGCAQLAKAGGGTIEQGGVGFGGRGGSAQRGDFGGHFRERDGALLRFDGFHTATRLFEIDDCLLEGNERRDFRVLTGFIGELTLLAHQPRAEEEVVDLARLAEDIEIDLLQQLKLIGVEFFQFRVPQGGAGEGIDAVQVAQLHVIALNGRTDLAGPGVERRSVCG
jgi:hypothetical protein